MWKASLGKWVRRFLSVVVVAGILSSCQPSLSISSNPLAKAVPTSTDPAPTFTKQPSPTTTTKPSPAPDQTETAENEEEMIKITILFDNYPYRSGLQTSWGFAALITYRDEQVLFDTGGSGSLLLANMAALNIHPAEIQAVVLSHEHLDHTGGLQSVLQAGAGPDVYIPPSFSAGFRQTYGKQARLIDSRPGMQIAPRIYTLGEMGSSIREQALVIDTTQGLVVITGCAHPGVDQMVLEAKRQFHEQIYLVLGGFHLGGASDARVMSIIKEFQRLGVEHVAPCHCTGDRAISMFHNSFGEDFIRVGVGAVIEIENR